MRDVRDETRERERHLRTTRAVEARESPEANLLPHLTSNQVIPDAAVSDVVVFNPTINLEANRELPKGFGVEADATMQASLLRNVLPVIKTFNSHSNEVMDPHRSSTSLRPSLGTTTGFFSSCLRWLAAHSPNDLKHRSASRVGKAHH